ncbi:MAG: tetratricopeptide repeat protein [Deltaproteobacteria bacterium]|nr:tetratricopeptide repeat protein [Deltaproteobacteria bacterium]
MLEARSLLAAGEWSKAEALWRKIAKRDPANTIAKVELSRSVEGGGDLKEALRIIDTARISDPSNVEVLFRAAELNLALGNRTAAVDNLALILYHLPSLKAARMARDLSEELGRLQDAFEYQEKVQSAGEEEALLKAAGTRLEFKKLLAEHSEPSDKGKKTAALKNFLKRYGDYAPALEHLATLEAENKIT